MVYCLLQRGSGCKTRVRNCDTHADPHTCHTCAASSFSSLLYEPCTPCSRLFVSRKGQNPPCAPLYLGRPALPIFFPRLRRAWSLQEFPAFVLGSGMYVLRLPFCQMVDFARASVKYCSTVV